LYYLCKNALVSHQINRTEKEYDPKSAQVVGTALGDLKFMAAYVQITVYWTAASVPVCTAPELCHAWYTFMHVDF